jgi:dihydrofolate synthase/folylpolyglutamate synthase
MRDFDPIAEPAFFELFKEYFDAEKDAGKQHDPANYSLERMYPLAELAGWPEKKSPVIHVAGTKGKGSTCHFLAALLTSAGQRTGLYTSPHLCTVRERFQIDNALLPLPLLTQQAVNLLAQIKQRGLKPSLFEIFTVLALKVFADARVDVVILETGIGGRLDATNYVARPSCTVITPISFDHVALLGSTIAAIAAEKAGILKPEVPLVLAKQPFPEAEEVVCRQAEKLNCPVYRPRPNAGADFLPAECPPFLRDNFAVAMTAAKVVGATPNRRAFRLPVLRARCETISTNPLVILDAAHNADSAAKLVQSLCCLHQHTAWTVVLGIVKGKDVKGMVKALAALPDATFILTNPETGKGSALPELTAAAREHRLPVTAVIPELTTRQQLPPDRPLLFTGSFFTALIGEKLFHADADSPNPQDC